MLQAFTHWVWAHIRGVTLTFTVVLSTALLIRGPQASIGPLRWGIVHVIAAGQRVFGLPIELAHLRDENRYLRSLVLSHIIHQAENRELRSENERLRQLLNFRERSRFRLIAARVLAHDSEVPPTTITIDVGFVDGVGANMPVMTPEGLLGRVEGRPAGHRSLVRLISNPSLRVAAVVENEDRGMGILRCDGKRLRVENVAQEARVREGDPVVTSGMGGIFPPGIYIGKVLKVRNDPHALFKEMLISPGARLDRLEEVFVVRETSPSAATIGGVPDAVDR